MMMTLEQSKNKEDYVTGWPGGLLPRFEYFVPFFVVIFYVISPTIAQILAGPRSRGGQPLMPNSGPFLYETQDQALLRAQSQRN